MYDCMFALTMFLIFAAAAACGFLADKIHQICFPLAAGGGGRNLVKLMTPESPSWSAAD